jgi:hypothetical protein
MNKHVVANGFFFVEVFKSRYLSRPSSLTCGNM